MNNQVLSIDQMHRLQELGAGHGRRQRVLDKRH